MDDKIIMNPVVADFCGLLESRNVPYELNDKDANMLRFRTRLPHHENTPLVFIHFNDKNQALTLALSQMVRFTSVGIDVYRIMNEFNADANNFGCKMIVDDRGELVVIVNAVVAGSDPRDQIEDYLNISILGIDNYLGRILETIKKNENE